MTTNQAITIVNGHRMWKCRCCDRRYYETYKARHLATNKHKRKAGIQPALTIKQSDVIFAPQHTPPSAPPLPPPTPPPLPPLRLAAKGATNGSSALWDGWKRVKVSAVPVVEHPLMSNLDRLAIRTDICGTFQYDDDEDCYFGQPLWLD